MTVITEFHYDFGSPNSYFCHRVIPQIEDRTGVRFRYVPILLGGVFKATNNRSPMEQFAEVKNKKEYFARETERFLQEHKLNKYVRNPHFPVNTLHIMRGACYAAGKEFEQKYIEIIYQSMWENGLKMDEPATIKNVLTEHGLPADEIISGSQESATKQLLMDSTSYSVERGNFGSPTFFVGQEMFFGKDRLEQVEKEILTQK